MPSQGYLSFLALEVISALAPEPAGPQQDAWVSAAREVVCSTNVGEVCAFELGPSGAKYLPNPEGTDFAAASHNDAFVKGPAA